MPIPGLTYTPAYLDAAAESSLLEAVDASPWLDTLKRRVQHYGYRYDYKARRVDAGAYLGPLPEWARPLADRLVSEGHTAAPDQLIVNEYEPGQGIAAHVDCVPWPCFGPVVCSVTLGSGCAMDLTDVAGTDAQTLYPDRGSLLVLAGESRSSWRHGIPARKGDRVAGVAVPRGWRVSLTFRTVLVGGDG